MIELTLGAILGGVSGYVLRAWLSARRRRAARAARIARSGGVAGSGERRFVPFRPEGNSSETGEEASSMVVRLQPGASEPGQAQAKESRAHAESAARMGRI